MLSEAWRDLQNNGWINRAASAAASISSSSSSSSSSSLGLVQSFPNLGRTVQLSNLHHRASAPANHTVPPARPLGRPQKRMAAWRGKANRPPPNSNGLPTALFVHFRFLPPSSAPAAAAFYTPSQHCTQYNASTVWPSHGLVPRLTLLKTRRPICPAIGGVAAAAAAAAGGCSSNALPLSSCAPAAHLPCSHASCTCKRCTQYSCLSLACSAEDRVSVPRTLVLSNRWVEAVSLLFSAPHHHNFFPLPVR